MAYFTAEQQDELEFDEKLERSLEVVGNRPLYEAAKDYPVDAWRVWTVHYPREYDEDSEEFLEAMQNFKKNAEKIRRHNAQEHDPRKRWALNNRADMVLADEWDGGTRTVYTGDIPHSYLPPDEEPAFQYGDHEAICSCRDRDTSRILHPNWACQWFE